MLILKIVAILSFPNRLVVSAGFAHDAGPLPAGLEGVCVSTRLGRGSAASSGSARERVSYDVRRESGSSDATKRQQEHGRRGARGPWDALRELNSYPTADERARAAAVAERLGPPTSFEDSVRALAAAAGASQAVVSWDCLSPLPPPVPLEDALARVRREIDRWAGAQPSPDSAASSPASSSSSSSGSAARGGGGGGGSRSSSASASAYWTSTRRP